MTDETSAELFTDDELAGMRERLAKKWDDELALRKKLEEHRAQREPSRVELLKRMTFTQLYEELSRWQ